MCRAVLACAASSCWLVALAAGVARAEDPISLMTADTAVVVRVDLARVDVAALGRLMFGREPVPPEAVRGLKELGDRVVALKASGVAEVFALLDLKDEAADPVLALPVGAARAVDPQVVAALGMGPAFQVEVVRGWAVVGVRAPLEYVRNAEPRPRPDLVAALREGPADAAVRVAFAPGATTRRAAEDSLPAVPPFLGGGPVKTLSEGLIAATLTLSGGPEPTLAGVARARDAAAAAEIATVLDRLKGWAIQRLPANPAAREITASLTQVVPRVRGDRVELAVDPAQFRAAAVALGAARRELGADDRGVNNLKQMALAMHNFESTFGSFPPAFTADAQGRPLLSWRVAILPFVEQQKLYDEFHLDEPWDSPHNKALIPRMPAVFVAPRAAPGLAAEGKTTYVTPRGAGTIFPGSKGIRLQDITDGTSATILILEVEGADAVAWTRPDDHEFAAPPKLGDRKAFFAIADGSVHQLRDGMPLALFRALLSRAGGEVLDLKDF